MPAKTRAHLDALEAASLRKDARDRLLQSFARCIGYVANPLLLTVAAYLILQGDMTVGQIVSVMFFIDIAGRGSTSSSVSADRCSPFGCV